MQSFNLSSQYVFFASDKSDVLPQINQIYDLIRAELDRHGIPRNQYFLGVPDGSSDGCVCLHEEGVFWTYYISERGARFRSAFFSSPTDGMNYLIWMFLCNPTNRNMDVGSLPFVVAS